MRELGLYLLLNHAFACSPDGQSRLSKWVIGKVVQPLNLEERKSHLDGSICCEWNGHGGFLFPVLRLEVDLYFQSSKLALINLHFLVAL